MAFGPDFCGRKKEVLIKFKYKGRFVDQKVGIEPKEDKFSHLYRLHVKPDNHFCVTIDNDVVAEGHLEDHFSFLEPRKVPNPRLKKPDDWVDEKEIPDPNDVKPDDYPERWIPDPKAVIPHDWIEEEDGIWEAPRIRNPDYK